MIKDHEKFKNFINSYLLFLEEMVLSSKFKQEDAKFLAQLRTAERSFNFILDQFPAPAVAKAIGEEKLKDLKRRRDKVANVVSTTIEESSEVKSRYNAYCEFLKDTRRLSSFL